MPSGEKPIEKVEISTTLVAKLIQVRFPQWAKLSIRPVKNSGWDNRTFRLGESMAVRLPSAKAYAGQVKKEQEWLPKLGPHLPLPIPIPLAMGSPSETYPWNWSIYQWLEGENAKIQRIEDLNHFAIALAHFLTALYQIDPVGGPPPGQHNFFRGGSLSKYDSETRESISVLGDRIDGEAISSVWETALNSTWQGTPVWFHGDLCADNLLVRSDRLSAVIDFGCLGIGDPAGDLTIAWTLFFGESRKTFRELLQVSNANWARGRGWALWKALITLVEHIDKNPLEAQRARHIIDEVLIDYNTSA
ncbi:aminoglycoside phosphotransferase family protein [bacterium]|nr:aminoglycoside phosphotransferase family protein [bacterium]